MADCLSLIADLWPDDTTPLFRIWGLGVGILGPSPALQFVLVEAEEVTELVNEGLAYLAAQFHLRPGQRLQRALKERDPVRLQQRAVGVAIHERDALIQSQQGAPLAGK